MEIVEGSRMMGYTSIRILQVYWGNYDPVNLENILGYWDFLHNDGQQESPTSPS